MDMKGEYHGEQRTKRQKGKEKEEKRETQASR
jgi:hypothetical protein